MSVLLPILTAVITALLAWRIWQHDKTSPERRKEFLVFLGALVVAITSAIAAVLTWADGIRAAGESRGRFETQLTRLDTLVGRTRQISLSSHALADSLRRTLTGVDSSLAHERVQSVQQQQVLTSLRTAGETQARQLDEQRALVLSQQRLTRQAWRQSFPLEFPIGVYAEIEYPVEDVGLTEFVDSLEARSRRLVSRKMDSIGAAQPRTTDRWTSHSISGGGQGQAFDRLQFRARGQQVTLETLRLYRGSAWVRAWHREPDKWFLTNAGIDVRIANASAYPPLELRFSAEVDTSESIFQLDRNLSPTSPFSITVDFRRRTVTQRIASLDVFVSFRSATLSLFDLPCSTIRLQLTEPNQYQNGRLVEAEIFFGFSEYQWQLQVPTARLTGSGTAGWQSVIRAADLFQSVWSEDGWSRHNGALLINGVGENKC